jgi:hypothetical protein
MHIWIETWLNYGDVPGSILAMVEWGLRPCEQTNREHCKIHMETRGMYALHESAKLPERQPHYIRHILRLGRDLISRAFSGL